MCLRFKNQWKSPDTRERMELAKFGLGLKELVFDLDGNAMHIHTTLLDAYESLGECGGYTLLRLATNSSDLLEIQPPKAGMSTRYLKDIVKSAKLYVRPLQADIMCTEGTDFKLVFYYFSCLSTFFAFIDCI